MSSSQALVRVGEPLDMYYTDHENAKKQAIATEYDTRYSQAFSNPAAGVSVFTLPPNQGVRHVLIVLGYSAAQITAATAGGVGALQRGWGYSAINQISFRIGGSSQYFLSGDQLLARNLRLCRTKEQRNSILSLGGGQVGGIPGAATTATTTAQYAYIPVSIWAAPGEDELGVPLPTDLLSQQVQVTCELAAPSSYWLVNGTGTPPVLPTSFTTAYFQVEQLQMKDRGMALANRINMNDHMYSMPLPTFDQQEVVFSGQTQASTGGSYTLTGFRAGEVKKIQVWLEPASAVTNSNLNPNSLLWVKPAAAEILYAGLKYSTYLDGSSAMWNLLDGTAPAAVDQSQLAISSTGWSSTAALSQWVELPFAQPSGSDYAADILVHGKEITNGIVNLQIVFPDNATYNVHVVYVYNCTLGFSKGSAELIF
jgi:hypothetical protein